MHFLLVKDSDKHTDVFHRFKIQKIIAESDKLFVLNSRLFGPRKKMTNAIARWQSKAPMPTNDRLEQAYADRLEGEMQEMALQLLKVKKYGNIQRYHEIFGACDVFTLAKQSCSIANSILVFQFLFGLSKILICSWL